MCFLFNFRCFFQLHLVKSRTDFICVSAFKRPHSVFLLDLTCLVKAVSVKLLDFSLWQTTSVKYVSFNLALQWDSGFAEKQSKSEDAEISASFFLKNSI